MAYGPGGDIRMGIGTKMCKYKSFDCTSLMGHLNGRQTVICSNTKLTKLETELIIKDLKLCSRRLCKHYESR